MAIQVQTIQVNLNNQWKITIAFLLYLLKSFLKTLKLYKCLLQMHMEVK